MPSISEISLSVVDQSPIRKGGTPSEALGESVRLAQRAEELGYQRYWVAEHHNSSSYAGTSPELLVGQIAGATDRIRVGSGGVMLTHYSALKVAEQFSILDSFYPGRIDLGIGRAPGSDGLTSAALVHPRRPMDVNHFPQMVSDLLGFLQGEMDEGNPMKEIKAQPGGPPETVPQVWLLGSSDYSARLAASLGLPFSFADFFGNTGEYGPLVADLYRREFRPSDVLSEPRVNVGIQVICAPTEDEAHFVGASRRIGKVLSAMRLTTSGLLPPEEAVDWPLTDEAKRHMEQSTSGYIEGDPQQVKEGILAAAERYQTGDLGVVSNCYYFEHRVRSFELVARMFGTEDPDRQVNPGTQRAEG
jgi:luciferase family oxidoreductase group 1